MGDSKILLEFLLNSGLFIYEFKLDRVSQFVAPFVTLFYQLNKRDRQGQGLEGS